MKRFLLSMTLTSLIASSFLLPLSGLDIVKAQKESQDLKPNAVLNVKPSRGWVGVPFYFDASDSTDSRGFHHDLKFRFNFDTSSLETTEWQDHTKITHTYETSGTKQVMLEVMDEDGLTDRTNIVIEVEKKAKYSGNLEVTPKTGTTATDFRFEFTVVKPISSPVEDYEWRYDFDGDGNFETDFSKDSVLYHTYADAGFKLPVIELRGPDGNIVTVMGYSRDDKLLGDILITSDGIPKAALEVTPSVGYSEQEFNIDASKSFDAQDVRNLEYRYDYDGDGVWDTDYTKESGQKHTYGTYGVKVATVEVKDSDGNLDKSSTRILVRKRDLSPYKLKITVRREQGIQDKEGGTSGIEYIFTTSARDREDNKSDLLYRWDFNGDGTFDTTFSEDRRAKHRFYEDAEVVVRVEVKDKAGNRSFATYPLNVVANEAPKVRITVDQIVGTTGTEFAFKAEKDDSQYKDSILQTRWDFDGDGKYDTDFEKRRIMRHKFPTPGKKNVIVQVRDPEGAVGTGQIEIDVLDNTYPTAKLKVEPQSGDFSTYFTFDASESFDGQTNHKDLKYRYDFNYDGENGEDNDIIYNSGFVQSSKRRFRFDDGITGLRKIRVQVRDENGTISEAYAEVFIHWSSPFMHFLKKKGVMRGYSKVGMLPDNNITRAELVTLILKSKKIRLAGLKYQGKYSDVSKKDWSWKYVEKASELGLVSGYRDGTFKPHQSINRAEAVSIITKAFPEKIGHHGSKISFPDVNNGSWYSESVDQATILGLVHGYEDGQFKPGNLMTRGQAAKVIALGMRKVDRIKV